MCSVENVERKLSTVSRCIVAKGQGVTVGATIAKATHTHLKFCKIVDDTAVEKSYPLVI